MKDSYEFCEFIIALLSLNVNLEECIKLSMVSHPKQRKILKVSDQVESLVT